MSDQIVAETVPTARPNVMVRRVGGEFRVGLANEVYSLSKSTAFIWRRVDGARSAGEISRLLAAEYDIDTETALSDTLEVLSELLSLGLLDADRDSVTGS